MHNINEPIAWRIFRTLTRRPLLTISIGIVVIISAAFTTLFIVTAIKSSWWWHIQKYPECEGTEATIAKLLPTITPPRISVTQIATGLSRPTSLASLPNGELLITEQMGHLVIVDPLIDEVTRVADLTSIVNSSVDNGLHTVTLHPNFGIDQEDRIYLFYNRQPDISAVIASVRLAGGAQINPSDLTILQVFPHTAKSHSGGALHFLPDGQLLVSIGDDMRKENAQDQSNFQGKLLVVSPDVPNQRPAIVGLGLRNPDHIAASPGGDHLWVTDLGKNCVEEVNQVPAITLSSISNFGWPRYEGNLLSDAPDSEESTSNESSDLVGTLIKPVSTYAHENGACAIIGGAFLADWYIFADYCDGIVRGVPAGAVSGTRAVPLYDMNSHGSRVGVFAIVGDDFGRVWALDGWGGKIFRLETAP